MGDSGADDKELKDESNGVHEPSPVVLEPEPSPSQSLFPASVTVMRHGRRMDSHNPTWYLTAKHIWDTPLSGDAGQEVEATAQLLTAKGKRFDVVYCSPFLRCLQTAERLLHYMGLNVPVYVHRGLSEVHTSHLIFKGPAPSLKLKLRKWAWNTYYHRHSRPHRTAFQQKAKIVGTERDWPPFPEQEYEAGFRFLHVMRDLAEQNPGRHVLFVSHGKAVQVAREAVEPEGGRVCQVHFAGFTMCRPRASSRPEFWKSFEPDSEVPISGVEFSYTPSPMGPFGYGV